MYKIEKKEYGFRLLFDGSIPADEMQKWVAESKKMLLLPPKSFGVFVDMRNLKPLQPDALKLMEEGQKLYKEKGMNRSVVILNSTVITMQFKRIAKESGIYSWERYIDASKVNNWEEQGVNWIKNGVDPD